MKLNLLYNSNQVMSGYLNVDILPGQNKVQGDLSNLNNLVDDASCTEIVARNVLEYISYNDVPVIVQHWVKKLRHGGKITINTTDLRSIMKAVNRDALQPTEILELLYGKQSNALEVKRSALSTQTLSALLTSYGLKVTNSAIDSYQVSITAERQ